jgi:hypothetical protein
VDLFSRVFLLLYIGGDLLEYASNSFYSILLRNSIKSQENLKSSYMCMAREWWNQ